MKLVDFKDPRIALQQHALKALGFDPGPIDGDDGPRTRAAYAAWLAHISPATNLLAPGAPQPPRTFAEAMRGWGVRHFTPQEVLTLGGSNARLQLNSEPPAALWSAIRPALLAADEARHRIGSGLIITSAYRNPAYNRAIGGATNSAHMRFRALDLIPVRVTPRSLAGVFQDLRREGYPGCQGIGTYSSFVHIDDTQRRDWTG
jgi:peptidoglycan hydrolase-like protein with peptidoglycan-binding domain